MRLASAAAFVCALLWLAPTGAATASAAADGDALEGACRHYDNRARFKPREGAVEFTVALADGCRVALATLADPAADGRRRAAAWRFLDRLAEARAEIARINRDRIADARNGLAAAASPGRGPIDLTRALRLVNPAGEFLILRAEGVFGALRGWIAAGADPAPVDAPRPGRARF